MHYVARWRMLVALSRLREEGATLAELADQLGYGSEAAFSRAFKRFTGMSPGVARRTAGATNGQHPIAAAAEPNIGTLPI